LATFKFGRDYYGSSLSTYREQPTIGQGPQSIPYPYSGQLAKLGLVSAGLAGLIGAGFIRLPNGGNVLSKYYMPVIRGVEEYSPSRILRTLQVSNFFSQFEDAGRATRVIPSSVLDESLHLQRYFTALTGRDFRLSTNRSRGLVFKSGKLFFGTSADNVGEELLSHAAIIRNKAWGASRFSEGIARAVGANIGLESGGMFGIAGSQGVFSRPTPFLNEAGVLGKEAYQVIGGKNLLQHIGRQVHGALTMGVERFNTLSRGINDLIPRGVWNWALKKGVPEDFLKSLHMGVAAGSAGKTLLRLAGKWALVGGGLYFGYDLADSILNRTLGIGPTKAIASAYVGARLTAASVGQVTGMSAYSRAQERIAPGSTSLLTVGAFPLMGAMAGGLLHYLQRINAQTVLMTQRKNPLTGLLKGSASSVEAASAKAARLMEGFANSPTWFRNTARWLSKWEIFGKSFENRLFDSPLKMKGWLGAAVGLAAVLPFIPGALFPQEDPDKLKRIYSGEELEPIRRGRFWEMGRSPWEGNNISYFRPNWYPILMSDARDKAIYGGPKSALEKFYLNNFTYGLEKAHYADRPYPVSGAAFEDFPLIGPLLAGTIGRLIKPPLVMHEAAYRDGNGGYQYNPPSFGEHRAYELGEQNPGAPISPFGVKATVGEQLYRFQEMVGLPGFIASAIKGAITGEDTFFSQETQLESSYRMYGAERNVWDRDLGGGFGIGEILRRVFPHRRREIPLYNPIRNTMPSWLPGSGERSPDFLHGDPYTKVPMGEERLPGPGYEALHPELKGINPEDYPGMYRYQILADVAPYADQTRILGEKLGAAKRAGVLSDQESVAFDTAQEHLKELMDKKEFSEYQNQGSSLNPIHLLGKYWETITHGAQTPLEYLTPLSPASKLIHRQTAVESYQNDVVYGTQNAFWQNPMEDFIAPFLSSTLHSIGWNGTPKRVQQIRDVEEYFDALKYIKWSRLKEVAAESHDSQAVAEFDVKRQESLVGMNPYTHQYSYIYRSLPRRDRDYFQSFSAVEDPEQQQKILSMVPENERHLYISRWKMNKSLELQKEKKRDGSIPASAEAFLQSVYNEQRTGGVPRTQELYNDYLGTRLDHESYGDWYRRTKVLPNVLHGHPLPGPDWVGWHPSVDLDDIKLKLVQNLGADMHDYDLWQTDQQNVARRPFINDQAMEEVDPRGYMNENEIRSRLSEILSGFQVDEHQISVSMYPSRSTEYNVDIDMQHDRSEDIKKVARRGI
jgi:hypothetical protein